MLKDFFGQFHRFDGRKRGRARAVKYHGRAPLSLESLESRILPNATTNGLPLLTVSGRTDQVAPVSAFDPSGRFAVVYQDNTNLDGGGGGATSSGIVAHFYDNLSHDIAGKTAVLVNTSTAGDQVTPAIAADGNGRYYIVWSDLNTNSIVLREFNSDGTAISGEIVLGSTNH